VEEDGHEFAFGEGGAEDFGQFVETAGQGSADPGARIANELLVNGFQFGPERWA